MFERNSDKTGMWVFIFLLVQFIYYIPFLEELHDFCIIPYFLRYQDWGFISRGFIGSLVGVIFPYISIKVLFCLIGVLNLSLCLMTAFFMNYVAGKNRFEKGEVYLLIFFISNPASVSFLFYWGNYGRFDLFMIMILIGACLLLIKGKYLWLLPGLCLLGNAIHQGFFFMYLPAILVLLFYNYMKNRSRSNFLIFTVSLAASAVSFLCMQFMGKINCISYETVIQTVSTHTDYELLGESMIKLEYFTPIFDFIPMYVLPGLKQNVIKVIVVLGLYLPAIRLFLIIWRQPGCQKKWRYVLPLIPLCMIIPKFVITVDYGRDFAAVIISEFMIVFTLIGLNDEAVKASLRVLKAELYIHKTGWCLYLLLMAAIGKFEAANILGFSEKIYQMIIRIL